MKKLLFVLVCLYALPGQATTFLKPAWVTLGAITNQDTTKSYTAKAKLNLKLVKLQEEVRIVRKQIPEDSVKLEKLLIKSREEQLKSKRKSEIAVGGDADDAKLAEKQAKRAAKHTKEAERAAKRLELSYKKSKDLNKKIEKIRQQLIKLDQSR